MRQMAAALLEGSNLMMWPIFALVVFATVLGIAMVRLARRRPGQFDDVRRLPLEEDRHE